MPHAPFEPDEPDDRPAWEPPPAWEPEPEPDTELDAPAARPWPARGLPRAGGGAVPAGGRLTVALAASAVPTVSFGLGLMTVGLHARGGGARLILAAGTGLVVVGLALLAAAVWRTGGLEPG